MAEKMQTSPACSPRLADLLHPVFLAEVPRADELDFNASFASHLLRVLPRSDCGMARQISDSRDIRIFLSYRNDVIPPAKQIFGNVPKISIRSQKPNTPAICQA